MTPTPPGTPPTSGGASDGGARCEGARVTDASGPAPRKGLSHVRPWSHFWSGTRYILATPKVESLGPASSTLFYCFGAPRPLCVRVFVSSFFAFFFCRLF